MPLVQYIITIHNGLLEGQVFYKYSRMEAYCLVETLESNNYKVSLIEERI